MSVIKVLSAAVVGFAIALPVQAAETKAPASVNESAPDKTGKDAKGKAGAPTLPSKGPGSVSESAPAKTGKEPPTALKADSKNMPNPKTPSSVSESAPDKTGKDAGKDATKSKSGAKSADPYK